MASSKVPVSLSTVYNGPSAEASAGLRWALEQGRPVDIDVHVTLTDASLEGFEDTVGTATKDLPSPPPIVLCEFRLLTLVIAVNSRTTVPFS